MSLFEPLRYGRAQSAPSPETLTAVLAEHRDVLRHGDWIYCGYTPLRLPAGVGTPRLDVSQTVDNMFRLGATCGFETVPAVVTCGVRTSRFAPIVFWEVLHVLATGGVWIDVDETARCEGTPLTATDFLEREYFAECLSRDALHLAGAYRATTWRKTSATAISRTIDDNRWSFGILTAGPSPRAAQMARDILALDLPAVEVIICGPRPTGLPDDARVRQLDLEQPEPRGWITRKKNLLAAAAKYENLCFLHDRYVVTPDWADALKGYGRCYSFVTFPHVYYAGTERHFPQRYPDYQVLAQTAGLDVARRSHVYDTNHILHPDYDDFSETSYCCGGLYISRKTLWQRVPQDEGLFHCEFEDVSFGLECQLRGLPHRVNSLITVESAAAHPMMIVRKHTLRAGQAPALVEIHISGEQQALSAASPWLSRPIMSTDRMSYYQRVRDRFNAMPGLSPEEQLPVSLAERSQKLSDFWGSIASHVAGLPFTTRDRIAELAYFLSDTIFRFSTPQVQMWIRDHERAAVASNPLARYPIVVGWGTGSAFRNAHRHLGRELAFVIDRDASKWGATIDGVQVRGPEALRELDHAQAAVVVFSCYFDEIRAAALSEGAQHVLPATEACAKLPFRPLLNFVGYFTEVERYYPNLFVERSAEAAA
jgi:hypothetical protein